MAPVVQTKVPSSTTTFSLTPVKVGLSNGTHALKNHVTPSHYTSSSDSEGDVDDDNSSQSRSDELDTPFTEFDDLVSDIKKILGPSSGINSADVNVDDLIKRLNAYNSVEAEWKKYAFEDSSYGYTRNGVDDINHKANLLILVWTPGQGSQIHDHANAHCIVKVLKGEIQETLYHPPCENQELAVKKVTTYGANGVTYMSDTLGLHRMHNPGTDFCVTLHLYTPPYASKFGCNVYTEDGESKHVLMSNLYSDNGIKNNLSPHSS